MGCTIEGPFQGELFGTVLAENMDFEDALSFCVTHPDCTGISTPFNAGMPFQAVGDSERFFPSDASYACSVLVHSCATVDAVQCALVFAGALARMV